MARSASIPFAELRMPSEPLALRFAADREVPNNPRLPLVVYRAAFRLDRAFDPEYSSCRLLIHRELVFSIDGTRVVNRNDERFIGFYRWRFNGVGHHDVRQAKHIRQHSVCTGPKV